MDIKGETLPATEAAQALSEVSNFLPLSTTDASPFEGPVDRTLLVKLLEYMLEVELTSGW